MSTPKVFILSGGIGAGKSAIANRLGFEYGYIIGSPATTMKRKLAKVLAKELNSNLSAEIFEWETFFNEMLDQKTKAKYRLLLQGFGEWFSDHDHYYWADQCVDEVGEEYELRKKAGVAAGIVFDSIRRPTEIQAIQFRWPNAIHVHLDVSQQRQIEYLTKVLEYPLQKAVQTLEHTSEHWLDDMSGKPYDAQYFLDANHGEESTWNQFLAVVIMSMRGDEYA